MRLIFSALLVVSLSACATTGDRASRDPRDPYEGFNRGVWAFNNAVDKTVLKPATTVYRTVAPVPARRGISHVFANLAEPFSFINNLLQGKPKRAVTSLGRFLINSTIGVGGLADHATDLGLPEAQEDFGQTLAAHGARKSPYLVMPLLGPSTVRDAVGTAVQAASDPARVVMASELSGTANMAVTGMQVVDLRAFLIETGADALIEESADPYATARSAYFQRREAQIRDQEEGFVDEPVVEEEVQPTDATEQPDEADLPAAPGTDAEPPESAPSSPPSEPETTPQGD